MLLVDEVHMLFKLILLQLIVNGMNGSAGLYVVKHVALASKSAPEPKLMLLMGD